MKVWKVWHVDAEDRMEGWPDGELLLASNRTKLEERRTACFTGVELSSWLSWLFLTTPTPLFSEAERGPNPDTWKVAGRYKKENFQIGTVSQTRNCWRTFYLFIFFVCWPLLCLVAKYEFWGLSGFKPGVLPQQADALPTWPPYIGCSVTQLNAAYLRGTA